MVAKPEPTPCKCDCCRYAQATIDWYQGQADHFKNDAKTWCGEYVAVLAKLNNLEAGEAPLKSSRWARFLDVFK